MFLYTKKCDQCGRGMDDGYVYGWDYHFCGNTCLTAYLYDEDICYYTTFDVKSDTEVGGEAYNEEGEAHLYQPLNNNKENEDG